MLKNLEKVSDNPLAAIFQSELAEKANHDFDARGFAEYFKTVETDFIEARPHFIREFWKRHFEQRAKDYFASLIPPRQVEESYAYYRTLEKNEPDEL